MTSWSATSEAVPVRLGLGLGRKARLSLPERDALFSCDRGGTLTTEDILSVAFCVEDDDEEVFAIAVVADLDTSRLPTPVLGGVKVGVFVDGFDLDPFDLVSVLSVPTATAADIASFSPVFVGILQLQ